MKIKELRGFSKEELLQKEKSLKEQLFKLNLLDQMGCLSSSQDMGDGIESWGILVFGRRRGKYKMQVGLLKIPVRDD
jgi:hypothetical protein